MDDRGGGCGMLMLAAVAVFVLVMVFGSGSSKRTTDTPSVSGNNNEVYTCVGEGACVFTTDNSTTDNSTSTTTRTDVEGDRNMIIGSDGTPLCLDSATGIYSACQ